jgi:hypothetical protein
MSRNLFQKLSISLIAIVQIFVSITCHNSELIIPTPKYEPPNDIRKIIPLAVGHTWNYIAEDAFPYDCSGDSFAADCYRSGTLTRSVVDSINDSGKIYFDVKENLADSEGSYLDYQADYQEYLDSTYYIRYLGNVQAAHPLRMLQAPLLVGRRWEYNPLSHDSLIILNVDASMQIGGINYNHGILLGLVSDPGENQKFIVPGVGVVWEAVYNPFWYGVELFSKNF